MIFEWWQLILGFFVSSGITAFIVEIGRKVLNRKEDSFKFLKDQIIYMQGEVDRAQKRSADKSKEISDLWNKIEDERRESRRLETELSISLIENLEAEYARCDTLNCLSRVPPRQARSIAREKGREYIENYKKNK